ncbi:MAG: hypothetical protein LBM65_02705 [Oscillospiraceae bacterium]|jgi:ABC-type transport system involved in multi-copper enzyme maturation permease subunit|nr:hypothetical protein [Oscillospiraceae bacterium]
MKNILKIELSRGFRNRDFLLSIAIGLGICIAHIVFESAPELVWQKPSVDKGGIPLSLFGQWIGGMTSTFSYIFLSLMPLLAAIPYAGSLKRDIKTGYIKNLYTRGKKQDYLFAKFISVFLTGGCAIVIPLIINFCITATLFPAIMPDPIAKGQTGVVDSQSVGIELFYAFPLLYIATYLLVYFFISGIFASIALSSTYFIKYEYVVLIIPFVFVQLISFLSRFINVYDINIQYWLETGTAKNSTVPIALAEVGVILLAVLVIYVVGGKKSETY